MRVHWEKLGILGPVYRLVGQGFSDYDIAGKLNVSEDNVGRWSRGYCVLTRTPAEQN